MPLSDQELRDVLARAEEIQRGMRSGADFHAELETVIAAAEEVGLSRAAMTRALRERLDLPVAPPEVGSLVYARSANDKFYVAEVKSIGPEGARVKFLRGSEHLVEPDQLRPCTFIPGERVSCEWPWWGPWVCTIIGYDAGRQRVKVSDGWGYTRTFPVAEIWMAPSRKEAETLQSHRRLYVKVVWVGLAAGALLGSLLTLLLT